MPGRRSNQRYDFTPEAVSAFACRLSGGRSLSAVCKDADMPSAAAVYKRMARDPDFRALVEAVRDPAARGPAPGGRPPSMWSNALAEGILAALREGFALSEICRSPGFPVGRKTVDRWIRTRPAFAAAYRAACAPRITERGLKIGGGRRGGYDIHIAHQICDRLLQGRSLTDIGRDPDMPRPAVIWAWARRHPEFNRLYQRARRAQLDVLLDDILQTADAPVQRRGPARRIVARAWQLGFRPYAAQPIEQGGASWAETEPDGKRRGRRTGSREGERRSVSRSVGRRSASRR